MASGANDEALLTACLTKYFHSISSLLSVPRNDVAGEELAKLLSLQEPWIGLCSDETFEKAVASAGRSTKYIKFFWELLMARRAVDKAIDDSPAAACASMTAMLSLLNNYAQYYDYGIVPILLSACRQVKQLTYQCPRLLEDSTRAINKTLNMCLNDRNPVIFESKTNATYAIANVLFQLYVHFNRKAPAKSLLRVIISKQIDIPPVELASRADQTRFNFYWGLLLFVDENYEEAEVKFDNALSTCYSESHASQEKIYYYLILTKLITKQKTMKPLNLSKLGLKSSSNRKYFQNILVIYECIRSGNVRKFDEFLQKNRAQLIKTWVYLAMERIRTLVIVGLLYNVHVIRGRTNRLTIADYLTALDLSGYFEELQESALSGGEFAEEYKMDVAESLIATAIFEGYVKGYIAHEAKKLVLSNSDPFPAFVKVKKI